MTSLLILASLIAVAAPAIADVYAEVYSDGEMSGVRAGAEVGGCGAHAYAEYMDFDEDHVPDTVPPGGRPPGSGVDTTCFA